MQELIKKNHFKKPSPLLMQIITSRQPLLKTGINKIMQTKIMVLVKFSLLLE